MSWHPVHMVTQLHTCRQADGRGAPMKIREILQRKGHDVITITPERSVREAVKVLVEHNIGGLVVMEAGVPTGIITERDVLRLAADDPPSLEAIEVGAVMSRDLITAAPDDDLHELMGVMTERRVRHLPVMEGERLAGIVSIGDLVNVCRTLAEDENVHLRRYIHHGG